MSRIASRTIYCPSCNAEIARHPRFVTQRVRELACPHCSAQLEVVIPALPFYLRNSAFVIVIAAFPLLLWFAPLRMQPLSPGLWSWFPAAIVVAVVSALDLAFSAYLRRGAAIRWTNQGSMDRKAIPGRWLPE
jgi:prepilin signal peptidase PulO-like enzyme (type II secretory pathway)